MKWVNHQIVTGVIVFAATDNLLLSAAAMAGAILPDKLEGNPRSAPSYGLWRSRHRKLTHWPLIYAGIILLLNQLPSSEALLWGILIPLLKYVCVGALLHIAEDAVCGRVPLLRPKPSVGVRLFKVGSVGEYVFAIVIVLVCYFLKIFSQMA